MTHRPLPQILSALGADPGAAFEDALAVVGEGDLPSWFAVTDLAVAAIGAAGLMLAQLVEDRGGNDPAVSVDRRLASLWFGWTLKPEGWRVPAAWDPIAGDYRAKDRWIRLHTNAPAHRDAALKVLDRAPDRDGVGRAVATWEADALETAIVEAGGCAAAMRSLGEWATHPQGAAVAREPLMIRDRHSSVEPTEGEVDPARPLRGLKVLDLTRVLAGPVAGRFLAAYGADVLRIDPPHWDEPGVVPEVTLGKRCAGLDLKNRQDRQIFDNLVKQADLLLHGYRPGALPGLGYDAEALRALNPRLLAVCLDAYGWSGPWAGRRGFDSLVQMSSGIADYGMAQSGAEKPVPLPVQALDHATGYLMAASALQALRLRARSGTISSARLSLARVAHLLAGSKRTALGGGLAEQTGEDLDPTPEMTGWGPARRVRFPLQIGDMKPAWAHPAGPLRVSMAAW